VTKDLTPAGRTSKSLSLGRGILGKVQISKIIPKMGLTSVLFYDTITEALGARGAIAQLVEHLHGMQGVSGSNPLSSIKNFKKCLIG
jgi:hypothetical protein